MTATTTQLPTITGYKMSRNQHREPVCRITLVGPHVIGRFATRMLAHQSEFYRMGKEILAAVPESSRGWEAILGAAPEPGEGWETDDGTVDGFRKYRDEHGQPVVVITLVCWHSIHRFAYNMLGWQVEFADMGRTILRSHRKAVGRETWKQIWEMYHGEAEKPMTFHWGREDD